MATFGWNELQAIQYLETTWRQVHQDPHPLELLDAPRQLCPEQDQLLELPDRDEEVADPTKQAQDKKKLSIRDFEEDAPPPNVIACHPFQYALQKIVIFEYVELWYFTREGCFEASRLAHSQADDAFGIALTNEILTLRPVALVKASKNTKADHELLLVKMLQAQTSYLEHIKEASWPEKHVAALFKFFWNLESHPFHLSMRHRDCILAMYAAKIRRHWHNKLKLDNVFNLTIINENLLQHIVVEVNDTMLGKVSNITLVSKISAPTHKCLPLPLPHPHPTPHALCHGGSLRCLFVMLSHTGQESHDHTDIPNICPEMITLHVHHLGRLHP